MGSSRFCLSCSSVHAGALPGFLTALLLACDGGAISVTVTCAQVDVTPASTALPDDGSSCTSIEMAVCKCPENGGGLCDETDLQRGRAVSIRSTRGHLDTDSLFLVDGRGETRLCASSDEQTSGDAVITVSTTDGWSGQGVVEMIGPMGVAPESVELNPGSIRTVVVTGAYLPLDTPIESGDLSVNPSFDQQTSLLTLFTNELVSQPTQVVVGLRDALGQQAQLEVLVSSSEALPTELEISSADETLPVGGAGYTVIDIAAAGVPDGTEVTPATDGLGSYSVETVAIRDGGGQCLFFAGDTPGTAVLYATLGGYTSNPIVIELIETGDLSLSPTEISALVGESFTFEASGAVGELSWSTPFEYLLACNGGPFSGCAGEEVVDISVTGAPAGDTAAGETVFFWLTDSATGAQLDAYITIYGS